MSYKVYNKIKATYKHIRYVAVRRRWWL